MRQVHETAASLTYDASSSLSAPVLVLVFASSRSLMVHVSVGIVLVDHGRSLSAAFADSYLKATKHRHPHTDGWKAFAPTLPRSKLKKG